MLSTTNERTQRSNAAHIRVSYACGPVHVKTRDMQCNNFATHLELNRNLWGSRGSGLSGATSPCPHPGNVMGAPVSPQNLTSTSMLSPVGSSIAVMLVNHCQTKHRIGRQDVWQSLGLSLFKRAGHTGFSSWRRPTRGTCNCQACRWLAAVVVVVASVSLHVLRQSTNILIVDQV